MLSNFFTRSKPDPQITIVDDKKQLDELTSLIDNYYVIRKNFSFNNCPPENDISTLYEYVGNLTKKYNAINSLNEPETVQFTDKFFDNLIILKEKIEKIEENLRELNFNVKRCKENEKIKKIIEENSDEYTHFDKSKGFDKTATYYMYNLESKVFEELGKFKEEIKSLDTRPRHGYILYSFENSRATTTVDNINFIFTKKDSSQGGKPKKTRRRKNKKRLVKRRSSKK
jgi:hypothetical protein